MARQTNDSMHQRKPKTIPKEKETKQFEEIMTPGLKDIGLADLVTMGNAVCGVSSIFFSLNYLENSYHENYIICAFILLPIGFLCDLFDGYIARNRYSSPFGKDLDSLADLISFGVAPACLGFTLGLRGIWDSVLMLIFVLCCLVRLARFNVTVNAFANEKGKVKIYEGLPSPSSLIICAILVALWCLGKTDGVHGEKVWGGKYYIYPGHFHPFSLIYLVFGIAFVSRFQIKKP
eukprot:snap_masked-scaffold_34-processed-gene-2.19-mRNA-1 protein AED:1.00 eAED:1.00 QI:0/-1/0/0/-1/1/1/0/233